MKKIENRFGCGELFEEKDLKGKIYCTCAACMSVWSDFLTFANRYKEHITLKVEAADTIVVLGCQVTDLAIINDLEVAHKLHHQTGKDIYMGGCLAQRFDIKLPDYIKRLEVIRVLKQPIEQRNLINYEKPFWVQDFKETEEEYAEGNLFRTMYPLKIGAGCFGRCKYCTIRDTRGEYYEVDPYDQIEEFLSNDNVVLISDSPTINQIRKWAEIAKQYNKSISIRNIEPQVMMACREVLLGLSERGLLKVLHCPIQSTSKRVINEMGRSYNVTKRFLDLVPQFRTYGTKVSTNIIIDYIVDGEVVHNCDKKFLDNHFDYWVWNPYFDGVFDYDKARERFEKYINNSYLVGYQRVKKD